MVTKAALVCVLITILHYILTIEQTNQTFDVTCDPLNNTDFLKKWHCDSKSLEMIAANTRSQTNLRINLKACEIQLTTQVNFTNLSSLTIVGESESNWTTIICKSSNYYNTSRGAGIVMSEIAEITLKNLHLSYCGSFYVNKYRSSKLTFSSALALFHCQSVKMDRVTIAHSKGIGLLILNHRRGLVNISSSEFNRNILPQEYIANSIYGGGGVYILLVGRTQETVYSPMIFHFHNCTFEGNEAKTKHYKFHYTNVVGQSTTGYGRGGGLHLSIMKGISNVSVSFSSCLFKNNVAFIGGGISVKTYIGLTPKTMTNIMVEISDSLFLENGCTLTNPTYYGGGACFAFTTYQYGLVITESHYSVRNVSFISNCGKIGGGLVYLSDRNRKVSMETMKNSMEFEKCIFSNNSAYFGSAVFMSPNIFNKLSLGSVVAPSFTDCHFMNNSVSKNTTLYSQHGTQSTMGTGTIYASVYNAYFHGYNSFERNWGTAIYVVHGVFNFQNSSALFINNTGAHGGAVALIGSSMLAIGSKNYSFISNRALYEGGAIYVLLVDNVDFVTSRSCFLQYKGSDDIVSASITWNSNIDFIGNRAKGRAFGHAIYATSIHSCEVVSNNINGYEYNDTLVNSSKIFMIRGVKFDDNPSLQPQIATSGALLSSSKPTPLVVIPGQECNHGVTIRDDLGQKVETLFEVSILSNAKNVYIDYSYTGDKLQLRGKPGEVARLDLKMISQKNTYIEVNVKLLDCPPGFTLNDDLECTCRAHAYWGLIKCDLGTFRSHLAYGLWAGLLNVSLTRSELITSPCPFCDYVSNDSQFDVVLPQNYSELNRAVCGETRTGIVCGRCQKNYTVHFHSPGFLCKPVSEADGCEVGWLLYILSELVPVTMVFIVVLVFNISFTSGTISSFVLFGQLLNTLDIYTSGITTFPDTVQESITVWTRVYQVIYGFINLEYFRFESISFCLWKDASALDMLAFKYVTILYTLLMIVVVILFVNKYAGRCCGRYCRITAVKTSMIHGISTFLMICYSQCIKVSLNILTAVHLITETDSTFKPSLRVWYNGEILYFSRNHLPYALPAIVFLCVIGIIPPVLLLSYPLINKLAALFHCDKLKVLDNCITKTLNLTIGRLKPLLDSFQGCFKDNYRFFSGLYFLYRWVFQCFFTTEGFSTYYTGVAGFLLFALFLHSICQPYVNRADNVIFTLLFTDLLLIDLLSFYNYHKNSEHRQLEAMVTAVAIQLILIYLPLIIMGIYIIHAMIPVKYKKKLSEFIKRTLLKKGNDCNGEEFVHLREIDESDNHNYHRIEDSNSDTLSL